MRALRRSSRHGALSALLLAVLAGCTGEAAERTTDDAALGRCDARRRELLGDGEITQLE